MTFARPPAADDPDWPRASTWLTGELALSTSATSATSATSITSAQSAAHPPAGPAPADLLVAGVPTSVGSISASNAWQTPGAVRAALQRLSPYEAATGTDLSDLRVRDLGDWPLDTLPLADAMADIHRRATALDPATPHVFIGGDNAITRPLVAGLLGPDLSRVGVLTLDAHHDVRTLVDGPRNGTPIRGLIDEDGLPAANVVQLGIGWFTNSSPYARWCAERGIHSVTADELHRRGVDVCVPEALDRLSDLDAIYVDGDIDVVDVAFAPACPGARPGGISAHDLLTAARLIGAHPKVAAFDLVEVDAAADHDGRTVMLTAMALLAFAAGVALRRY